MRIFRKFGIDGPSDFINILFQEMHEEILLLNQKVKVFEVQH